MYKIFINETPLLLISPSDVEKYGPASDTVLILRHSGKRKFLLNIIDQLEKSRRFERIVVFDPDAEKLRSQFREIFKPIEAAGGLVFNPEGKVLSIYRRQFWDLPKGKIDPGETPEKAAVREVQEETGIHEITLGAHLVNTFHTYRTKKNRILKKTFWYRMETPETELTPQTEEDIEEATWKSLDELSGMPKGKFYNSLREVLIAGEGMK